MSENKYTFFEKDLTDLIKSDLKFNLLNLIYDNVSILLDKDEYNYTSEITDIKDEIYNIIINLNSILNNSIKNRDEYINKIKNLKNKLSLFYESINLYKNFSNLIIHFFTEQSMIKKLHEKENITNFDFKNIITDIYNYIYNNGKDDFYAKYEKGNLLSLVPLRMTKNKYREVITNAFIETFIGLRESFVDKRIYVLKQVMSPFSHDDYGKYFPLIKDKLDDMWKTDYINMTKNELNKLIENCYDTRDEIEKIIDTASMYYNHLNYIENILLFCVDNDYLYEDDILFKDIYYTTCNIIKDKSNIVFADKILNDTEKRIDLTLNEINRLEKTFYKIAENKNSYDFPEKLNKYIKIETAIKTNFNNDIKDTFLYINSENKDKLTDEKYIKSKADEFLSYIENSLYNIEKDKRKHIKNIIFSYLCSPFKDNDLIDYIAFTIEKTNDNALKYITYVNIVNFLHKKNTNKNTCENETCQCHEHKHEHEHHCHHCCWY